MTRSYQKVHCDLIKHIQFILNLNNKTKYQTKNIYKTKGRQLLIKYSIKDLITHILNYSFYEFY